MKPNYFKQKLKCLFSEKKKTSLFFSEKGMALIITLVMVTLLTGWALSINLKVRNTLVETIGLKKRIMLSNRAAAGIDIAKIILIKDKDGSKNDSVQEFWADKEKIKEYVRKLGYSKQDLNIQITDELSKIQINALVNYPNSKNGKQVKLWERFLDGLRVEFPELIKNPYDIINPLLDWLDYGDDDAVTGLTGAEKPYYEAEKKRYLPRNGPIKSIEELSQVKGVTEKLWNKVSIPGIAEEYLTTCGMIKRSGNNFSFEGKININTAPKAVITALIKDNAFLHVAEEVVAFREEKSQGKFLHELNEKWYKKCPGCEEVPFAEDLITESSDVFRIISSASEGDFSVSITCIVKREKDENGKSECTILKWIMD